MLSGLVNFLLVLRATVSRITVTVFSIHCTGLLGLRISDINKHTCTWFMLLILSLEIGFLSLYSCSALLEYVLLSEGWLRWLLLYIRIVLFYTVGYKCYLTLQKIWNTMCRIELCFYIGRSPSSSESTTPEALTPSANPPCLQPIKEGCCQQSHLISLPRTKVGGGATPVRSSSPVESTALWLVWETYWLYYQVFHSLNLD